MPKASSRCPSVPTTARGGAAAEFQIPGGRPLGPWRVEASPWGSASVRVEEYKRPTFEVTVKAPEQALRLNRQATLRGEARYYFGLPVTAGTARWRVTRQPLLPPWWSWWGWWGGRAPSPQVIAAGEGALAEDGSWSAAFVPAADERAAGSAEVSFQYKLAVDVTDEGGETRSAERSFRLGQVAIAARVVSEQGFFRDGLAPALTVVREDLDGEPRAGKGSWRLVELAQPATPALPADLPARDTPPAASTDTTEQAFATPGDGLRPRWTAGGDWHELVRDWADGRELAHGATEHDARGVA